jgi:hypothetical protein
MTVDQSLFISLIGAGAIVFAFVLYNRRDSQINTATWLLLVAGDSFDAATYLDLVAGKSSALIPFVFAIGSIVTFVTAWMRDRFTRPSRFDCVIIAIDVYITWQWGAGETSAADANVRLQLTSFIAFIPLYFGVLRGDKELKEAWALWSLGGLCFLGAVWLAPHEPVELVFPVVVVITHLCVLLCIAIAARKKGGSSC